MGGWEDSAGQMVLVCETSNYHIFLFTLNPAYELIEKRTNEELLGARIEECSFRKDLVLAKEESTASWKVSRFISNDNFDPLLTLHCDKALLGDGLVYYFSEQNIFWRDVEVEIGGVCHADFKYGVGCNVFLVGEDLGKGVTFLIMGIKFYRVVHETKTVTACGFAIKNEKAKLLEVDPENNTLLYFLNDQFLLLDYIVAGDKVSCRSRKSSKSKCVAVQDGMWGELSEDCIRIGAEEKVLA